MNSELFESEFNLYCLYGWF